MKRRNVLLFIHSLSGGGAERVTANLANWWINQGWRVTIVTLAPAEEDFYSLDARVARISLCLASQRKGFFQSLQSNLRRVAALRSTLASVQPDFAIAMMTTSNVLLGLASRNSASFSIGSERI